MKKLLLVLAIGAFVACNDNASGTGSGDSSMTTGDSMGTSIDTGMSKMADTGMSRMMDTGMSKMADTTK